MAVRKQKLVMIGRKNLLASVIKEDPITHGEVLELSGKALEYALGKMYEDGLGVERSMFVPYDSPEAKRLRGEDGGGATHPQTRRRRRRAR